MDQRPARSLKLVVVECAQLSLKPRQGNRLDLLEMKDAVLQKRLFDWELPAIMPHGRRVRNDDHQGKFVVGRIITQNETRTNFHRQAEVGSTDLSGTWLGHPRPPSRPTSGTVRPRGDHNPREVAPRPPVRRYAARSLVAPVDSIQAMPPVSPSCSWHRHHTVAVRHLQS
jgi:hypothetical protein